MVDVDEMEQQHRKLIGLLNRLKDAVNNHESRKDIYRIIDDVISFTGSHFANEEQLMVKSGFPEIDLHKNHHVHLMKEAHRLKEKYDYAGEEMFVEWFNHWYYTNVLAHIQYADKAVEDHIIQGSAKG